MVAVSTFLPASRASSRGSAGSAGREAPPVETRRARVLVVDDDPDFLESMRFVLEGDGYQVGVAVNGEEAMHALRVGQTPDLIILDLMMPVKNGWQVWDELQLDTVLATVPVIIMTSTGLRQGAVGGAIVLPKNISALVLLRRIAGALKLPEPR
jgi:CheY-like chemotaxis protein